MFSKENIRIWFKHHQISIILLLLLLGYAAFVPMLFDAANPSFATALKPPSGQHVFGTDHFGFDLFVRTAQSLRVSLLIGSVSALIATALGTIIGLVAATIGGLVDRIIMRINDAVNSVPHLILSVVIVSLFKGSMLAVILSIALTHWCSVARVIRSSVLAARTSDYVDASYSAGASAGWVLRHHLAPAATGQSIIAVTLLLPHAVWHESALSFLGLGIQPDQPSLGTLMDLAREDIMRGAWWTLLFPALVLLGTTLSIVSLVRPYRNQHRKSRSRGAAATETTSTTPVITKSQAAEAKACNISINFAAPDTTEAQKDAVSIVSAADITLYPGKVHGLIGASGSGKTTLGRAIAGVIPDGASVAGAVQIAGTTLTPQNLSTIGDRRSPWDKLRGTTIALVPQSPALTFTPVRRIGAQLQELINHYGTETTVANLLTKVHLPASTAEQFPHQLSGGMAQRAALAAALAGNPRFIIADEPTSALDPELTTQILLLLSEIAADGPGILLISHDIEELKQSKVCDIVSVMHNGVIVETGLADNVLEKPTDAYTHALLAALPSGGLVISKEAIND